MNAPECFKPCSDTGKLAAAVAADAATLVDALSELIGAGSEDANTLAGLRLMAARVGMVADALARAHGGVPWSRSADDWAWPVDDQAHAWRRIQRRSDPDSCSTPMPGDERSSRGGAAGCQGACNSVQPPDP